MSATLEKFLHTNHGSSLARKMMNWDKGLVAHSLRAATVADRLVDHLRLNPYNREFLVVGMFLHDIGKLLWPRELLDKRDLDEYDRTLVLVHPELGGKVVTRTWPDAPEEILDIIREHHERVNGSGYPLGRRECDMHHLSVYAAAVECFTAMTEPRSYRADVMSAEEALAIMKRDHPAEVIHALSSLVSSPANQKVSA